jgi:hypothetical protein
MVLPVLRLAVKLVLLAFWLTLIAAGFYLAVTLAPYAAEFVQRLLSN